MLTDVAAREQMVEQQVRAWDVLDARILDTIRSVPRERFVPPAWQQLAYADTDIALPAGKRMLRPMLVGRILQALQLTGAESVLEIGTGSGYLSACLGRLCARVRSLELHPQLADMARANLAALPSAAPVQVAVGDGMQLADEALYDVVVLTAALPIYEPRFERALKSGGRLFVVVGATSLQQARLIRRSGNEVSSEVQFETCLEWLEGSPRPPQFLF